MEENSHTNSDMHLIGNGQYLSRKDPLFWHKLLKRQPDNAEALYHVSLDYEREAKAFLHSFRETKKEQELNLYKEKMHNAIELMAQSLGLGYLEANKELKRMTKEHKVNNIPVLKVVRTKGMNTFEVILLCLIAFLIGLLIAGSIFIYQSTKVVHEKGDTQYIFIPYQIENTIPKLSSDIELKERIITVSANDSNDQIVNKMLGTVRQLHIKYPDKNKRIYAVAQTPNGKIQMGVATFKPSDSMIKVFLFKDDKKAAQLWETTTVVRSAVFQYAKEHKKMPDNLSDLSNPFPENYLTDLPFEPITKAQKISPQLDGKGGWFYKPISIKGMNDRELKKAISTSVCPNLLAQNPKPCSIPFEPLKVQIDKKKNMLSLTSGQQILSQYPVALGKDNKTPDGLFFIQKKVVNPNKGTNPNPYGTRGMELSNPSYAIHGTNNPDSIGKNVSMGCIRMNNGDIEQLYAMTPKNTPVLIGNQSPDSDSPSGKGTPSPSNGQGSPSQGEGGGNGSGSGGAGSGSGEGQGDGSGAGSGSGDGNGSGSGSEEGSGYPQPSSPKEETPKQLYNWSY